MFAIRHPWMKWTDRLAETLIRRWREDSAVDIAAFPAGLREDFFASAPFQAYATKAGPGLKEVVREPLYSFKVAAAAGQVQLSFFDQNFGAATNGYGDTNMQQPNMLPAGEGFLITNLRVIPLPARADYDTAAAGTPVAFGEWFETLNRNCWLEWWILQKPYLRVGPLSMFPAGIGPGTSLVGAATVLRNIAFGSNGAAETTSLFLTDPPLLLQPLDNFYALMRWQAVLTVTTAGKLGVAADGYHIRNIQ